MVHHRLWSNCGLENCASSVDWKTAHRATVTSCHDLVAAGYADPKTQMIIAGLQREHQAQIYIVQKLQLKELLTGEGALKPFAVNFDQGRFKRRLLS